MHATYMYLRVKTCELRANSFIISMDTIISTLGMQNVKGFQVLRYLKVTIASVLTFPCMIKFRRLCAGRLMRVYHASSTTCVQHGHARLKRVMCLIYIADVCCSMFYRQVHCMKNAWHHP